jgi:uncharacterized membrane protein
VTQYREWIELGATAIELLAVVIMLIFIAMGTVHWLLNTRRQIDAGYARYRIILGKALLVGLELLVAADIIRTVTLDATLTTIATLGALVLVRTFLGWSITVEIEGRWPWESAREEDVELRATDKPRA